MTVADHFHVSPWEVWTVWPLWFVQAANAVLPALQAEASMRAAQETAVGSGSMKDSDQRSVIASWKQTANTIRNHSPIPRTKEGFAQLMASMGVRRVDDGD